MGKHRRVTHRQLGGSDREYKIGLCSLFEKNFNFFVLGNFQFLDQENGKKMCLSVEAMTERRQIFLTFNFALIFYIKQKGLETANKQKDLTGKQSSQQVKKHPKGSFYMSQIFLA